MLSLRVHALKLFSSLVQETDKSRNQTTKFILATLQIDKADIYIPGYGESGEGLFQTPVDTKNL